MNAVPYIALIATTLTCAALVHGPVSGFARAYVRRFDADPDEDTGAPSGASHLPAGVPPLLNAWPQTTLALCLSLATTAWAWHYGAWVDGLIAVPVVSSLAVAGSIDAVCHRLPNKILGWAGLWCAATLVLRLVPALADHTASSDAGGSVVRAAMCALALGVVGFVMTLLPSGLGMGDAKLMALFGLWLGPFGWTPAMLGVLAGFFLAGVVALVLLAVRAVGRKQMIAIGPYLIAGAWITWLLTVALRA